MEGVEIVTVLTAAEQKKAKQDGEETPTSGCEDVWELLISEPVQESFLAR
jgi:hypothetical protein